jgi:ribosomal-protein-alanine N-acetyltransferase
MLQLQLVPFPELATDRLILREPLANDSASLFELRSDEEVMKYVPRPPAKILQDVVDFISMVNNWHQKKNAILWFICKKEDPLIVIGTIGFWKFEFESYRVEVGYMLHLKHQNKGYMSEAIQGVLQYGFDVLNLHSVEARVDPENIPSFKILERIGFVREGYLTESLFNKGQFRDNIIYSLLKRNYLAMQSK